MGGTALLQRCDWSSREPAWTEPASPYFSQSYFHHPAPFFSLFQVDFLYVTSQQLCAVAGRPQAASADEELDKNVNMLFWVAFQLPGTQSNKLNEQVAQPGQDDCVYPGSGLSGCMYSCRRYWGLRILMINFTRVTALTMQQRCP